jgi:hypothetical protein
MRQNFDFDEEPDELPEELRAPKKTVTKKPVYYNAEDELYKTYGLRPSLPLQTKVENLHLIYRLPVRAIATLLEVDPELVQAELNILNEEWKRMGQPLTSAEREMQRGRYIAALDKTIQQIDDAVALSGSGGDPRSLSLKMSAMEKKAKLLGLDLDRGSKAQEEEDTSLFDEVEQRINCLPTSKLEEMMAHLEDQSSSTTSIEPAYPAGNSDKSDIWEDLE